MNFRGQYAFLSNFYPAKVTLDGVEYPCVEIAFQAAKTLNPVERKRFQGVTATESKKLGRKVTLRPNWGKERLTVMASLLAQKFAPGSELLKKLQTIKGEIVEDNNWNDTVWGKCNGIGLNYLGQILMFIRDYKP